MGMAGLVAANRLAELGVDVLIMDKQPDGWWIGGDAIVAGQAIHICGLSPMMPEDQLLEIIYRHTDRKVIPELAATLVKNCHRSMNWLIERGVEFEEQPGQERILKPKKPASGPWALIKPGAIYDSSKYGGYKAMKLLESRLEGATKVLYETKAEKLLTGSDGEVVGVLAKGKFGLFKIKAKATILCTGGFQRNREMLLKYIGPHVDQVPVFSEPGATGDGILMALEAGAAIRSMNYMSFNAWPEAACVNEDIQYLNINPVGVEGIIVNKNGERLCDESQGSNVYGSVMAKLSLDTVGLMVIDDEIYRHKVRSLVDSISEFKGKVYSAGTIEELAEKAGVSPYLTNTVAEFNEAVGEGKASRLRVPKEANVNRIASPPFYGIPFTLGQVSTFGGLLVNVRGEVLDRDSKMIPGLYAAGAVMQGSLSGGSENRYASYVGHLATCLVFGILSAENAFEYVKITRTHRSSS
jgi:succinate dehydrogenase/fumarate reductase flavoprotein subunit